MNCDQCDNEATVFLTEFSSGKVRKVSLCEHCARERSVVDEATGLELSDLLWGLGNPDQKVSMEGEGAEQELLCPHCGFTEADFDKTERLGCPYCFGVFAERLSGMWKNFQSGAAHTGKRPLNADVLAAALATPPVTALPPPVATEKTPVAGGKEKPRKKATKTVPDWEEEPSAAAEAPATELTEFQKRIAELQAQMAEALNEEAYEHAATLRDEIRDFERKIQDLETKRDRMQGKVANPTAASHANISSGGPE